jgi:hypothetical protein
MTRTTKRETPVQGGEVGITAPDARAKADSGPETGRTALSGHPCEWCGRPLKNRTQRFCHDDNVCRFIGVHTRLETIEEIVEELGEEYLRLSPLVR